MAIFGDFFASAAAEIRQGKKEVRKNKKCGPMPSLMAALPNIGDALY